MDNGHHQVTRWVAEVARLIVPRPDLLRFEETLVSPSYYQVAIHPGENANAGALLGHRGGTIGALRVLAEKVAGHYHANVVIEVVTERRR